MGLVKVESSEGITTITMARAEKRNALTQQLCDELFEAYRAFEHGDDQVAVLQADGPAFCVGADLKDPPAAMWKAVPDVSYKLSKPVVAATQGWVIGGGICLVMTCDLMVSADTTKFMYPEAKVGVFGGLMPGIVSRTRSMRSTYESREYRRRMMVRTLDAPDWTGRWRCLQTFGRSAIARSSRFVTCRGCGLANRIRSIPGMSWTASRSPAKSHAESSGAW